MKYYILTLLLNTILLADITSAVVHSSVSTYYEDKTFKNSVQKSDSVVYGVGADIHHDKSQYKLTYEHSDVDTKQPPLTKDLKIDKLFLKYAYNINDKFNINLNHIRIQDNIAETDGGKIYALGLTYKLNKKLNTNFTQYYSNYDNFDVYQSDLNIIYKLKLDKVELRLKSVTKYININQEHESSFTKNAKDEYLTSGILFHAHYNSYHLGGGAYFGKRVFAIMSDGFKVQHHSMEIKHTYALGVGKTISDFIFRIQYIYQEAEELPIENDNVEIRNVRFIANYKF
jgi:hypothetical protein